MKNYLLLIFGVICLFFVSVNLFDRTKVTDVPFPSAQEQEQIEEDEEIPAPQKEIPTPPVEEKEEVDPFGRYIGDGCKTISLCNGPITCVDSEFDNSNMGGNCRFLPEYACYKDSDARCEKQSNGQCGWTQTEELSYCIANATFEN